MFSKAVQIPEEVLQLSNVAFQMHFVAIQMQKVAVQIAGAAIQIAVAAMEMTKVASCLHPNDYLLFFGPLHLRPSSVFYNFHSTVCALRGGTFNNFSGTTSRNNVNSRILNCLSTSFVLLVKRREKKIIVEGK